MAKRISRLEADSRIEEDKRQVIQTLSKYTGGDIYGDAQTEDYMLFQIPVRVWQALKGESE